MSKKRITPRWGGAGGGFPAQTGGQLAGAPTWGQPRIRGSDLSKGLESA